MKHLTLSAKARIFGLSALGLTMVSVILRCVNLFIFFDADIGYFRRGAILPIFADILAALSLIGFAAVASIWLRKTTVIDRSREDRSPVYTSALWGALAFSVLVFAGSSAAGLLFSEGSLIENLLGFGAAAYFGLLILDKGSPLARVLTGLCVILRLVLLLASSYFNIAVQMNAPDKLMLILSCLCCMLFLVCELRILVADADTPFRRSLYWFSTAAACLMGWLCALPSLLASIFGGLTLSTSVFGYCLIFALANYACIRLLFATFAVTETGKEEKEEPVTEAFATEATEELERTETEKKDIESQEEKEETEAKVEKQIEDTAEDALSQADPSDSEDKT